MELSEREIFIKKMFLPEERSKKKEYIEEEKVNEIVIKISKIGESIGFVGINQSEKQYKLDNRRHKYDVWIAKEVKKDIKILDTPRQLSLIVDWAFVNKIDIFKHDFQSATLEQSKWHKDIMSKLSIKEIPIPGIDKDRILYRCSGDFFIYVLISKDLKYEGEHMKNCVGGRNYSNKIKKKKSIIISLRDFKNEPHVTIEISTTYELGKLASSDVLQMLGKGNSEPKQKYVDMLLEFILFLTDFPGLADKDRMKYLNINNF